MWTPKRVLLLIAGFAFSVFAYFIYAMFLGYVDGLPPLPTGYEVNPGDDFKFDPKPRDETLAERRLRLAFGDDCPELRRAIKLDINKYLIAIATDEITFEDGRVKMVPFSMAIFGKDDGRYPEINTVRSDVAYLTFDQPVNSPAEIGNRKIVAAELRRDPDGRQQGPDAGGVRLVNNRRSPQRDDDLTLFTPGPVYYQDIGKESDKEPHIWTAEAVRLRDEQSRPNPTEVVAIGMDVYLVASEPPTKKPDKAAPPPPVIGGDKSKQIGINGVKSVRLRSDVDMYLWIDGQAGFLGMNAKKPPQASKEAGPVASEPGKPAPSGKSEKAQLQIKTQGPFYYDVIKDRARFDISQHPGPYPNNVVVRRTHVPDTASDQLVCDHLELQFQRKSARSAESTPASADRAVELEIQTAHAWGSQVTLTSDLEGLTAFGNDLTYDAPTRVTVLKGSPEMVVMQKGNEIYARELVMQTKEEGKSEARGKGPGHIRIFDSSTNQRTVKAHWNDTLISAKEGDYDVLTLTGQAAFDDPEHNQELQANQLKVWLEPSEPAKNEEGDKSDGQRRRPHHVEAVGQVVARSPEMNVHDTEQLVIWFKDAPGSPSPAAIDPARPTAAPGGTPPPAPGTPSAAPTPAESQTKARKPVDLSARSVEAHVLRYGNKNELDRLWCEGSVRVIQEPNSPQDKGTDIHGQTLELKHYPEGHVLTVTGDPAEVQLDKIKIYGPEVNIDQKENKATVHGAGAMKLPSETNFQGNRCAPTDLTVYWNREMFFDGRNAIFHDGVQAEQDQARLVCRTLQVVLDKPVSLKEGQRSEPAAKVRNLVCDQSVRVEDTTYQDQKLLRFTRIDSTQLLVNNEDSVMTAPGPGVVRILQPGPKSENMGRPNTPQAEEIKLTRISYLGRMLANNNTRTAVFYENVELVHVPTSDANLAIDIDKMPDGAFYLRCDLLTVYQRRESANKTYQQMEARGRAAVQAKEFWGRADVIKFDESKDLIIFEASEGNLATLYRQRARGVAPEEVKGRKIYYWRRTNDFKIEGATRLEANQ